MYIGFTLAEPYSATCTTLAEVMGISHDSVNRFLARESYSPRDLFNEVKSGLSLKGGSVSVDDSVIDKPYSQEMDLVGYFWSGKHHRVVKGINLITLYYVDPQGRGAPVNYRVYDPADGKTKNDYFQEMLAEVMAWGLDPAFVSGDSWYSSLQNLKKVRNYQRGFLYAVESNRLVSIEKGGWIQVQQMEIPEEGCLVWLRGFGKVKLFRTWLKDQPRHYVVFLPNSDDYERFGRADFKNQHDRHWEIEQYHRTIKQVCNIEKFQVRRAPQILNHIFAAICGYCYLQEMRFTDLICNAYQWRRDLYKTVVCDFIRDFMCGKDHLNPQYGGNANERVGLA